MAVDVSQIEAQATVPEAPAAPPSDAQPTPVETTPSDAGRGQSPAPGTPSDADQTPPETPAAPDLRKLLEDPHIKRQFDGMTGERIRRERETAKREAAADAERMAEQRVQQQEAARRDAQVQEAFRAEMDYRAREDAYEAQLVAANDPYQLEEFIRTKNERRGRVDQQWASVAQQQQQDQALAQYVTRIQAQTSDRISREDMAWFHSLPIEVQQQTGGKDYPSRTAWLQATREADVAYHQTQWQSDIDARVEAEVAKRLGKTNLTAPGFDQGRGGPPGAGYQFMEDVEAAYRKGDIKTDQYVQYRDAKLPYRRGL